MLNLSATDPRFCFAVDIQVRDYELDSEGIVNNAIYLHYLEHTRHAFCLHAGISFDDMRRRGLVPMVYHLEAQYLRPLRSGDTFRSALYVEAVGVRFIFHQALFLPDGRPVMRADVTIVTTDNNGTIQRGDELRQLFAHYLNRE